MWPNGSPPAIPTRRQRSAWANPLGALSTSSPSVQTVQLPPGFAMVGGRATADIHLTIDANRTMLVKAGTPGEIECLTIAEPSQCIVAADLFGDGVLWFSLVPGSAGAVVSLPAVVELLPGGWVRLANDWVVHHAAEGRAVLR